LVNPDVRGGDVSFFKTKGTFFERVKAYVTAGAGEGWLVAVGAVECAWLVVRLIFIVLSLFMLCYQRRYFLMTFILLYLFYFSMITGHDGCARFRMLFEFLLIALTAAGIDTMLQRFCQKRSGSA